MTIEEFKKIYYADKKTHSDRREIFNCQNSVYLINQIPVDILFIGSSNTERFEIYPYFNRYGTVVNRGIGGESTGALLERFDADVIALKPKVCVIQEGANNAGKLWRIEHSGEKVTEQMIQEVLSEFESHLTQIVDKLIANGIIAVLGSVFPLGVKDVRNGVILRENQIIKRICAEKGAIFVDYYSALVSDDGITMQDLSIGDDLHLHVLGYNKVAECLYPVFDKIFGKKKVDDRS